MKIKCLLIIGLILMLSCNENPTKTSDNIQNVEIGTYLLDYEIRYDSNGDYAGTTDYKYNDKGQNIEYIYYDYDSTINWHYQYEYNPRGLLYKEISINKPDSFWPDDTIETRIFTIYSYDDKDRLISKHYYDKDSKLTGFSLYTFNSQGLKEKFTNYRLDSTATYWCIWEYYPNDSISKVTQFYEEGKIDEYRTYEYNKYGITCYRIYNSDSTLQAEAFMGYDSLGRIETEIAIAGNSVYNYRFDYDPIGNLVSYSFCHDDNTDSCRIEEEYFYIKYTGKALRKEMVTKRQSPNSEYHEEKWKVLFQNVINKTKKTPFSNN